MNAEFLVASLWAVVVVYWVWARRGTGGDSIGSFRRELSVLEHATPARVSPANRLCPPNEALADLGAVVNQPALGHEPLPAPPSAKDAARQYRLAVMRRRRLRVLSALGVAVVVSLVAAVATMSMTLVGLQLLADVALAGYVALLAWSRSRASLAYVAEARRAHQFSGPPPSPAPRVGPARATLARLTVAPPAEDQDILLEGYRGAHVPALVPAARLRRVVAVDEDDLEPYGDFGSYASLALAQAN